MKLNKLSLYMIPVLLTALMTQVVDAKSKNDRFLLVQTAVSSSVQTNPTNPEIYTIILKSVNPQITYFADRPARKTGLLPMGYFSREWLKGFGNLEKNSPNADLALMPIEKNKKLLSIPIALISMEYDEKTQSATYTFKRLMKDGETQTPLDTNQFGHTALFIEDVCIPCADP